MIEEAKTAQQINWDGDFVWRAQQFLGGFMQAPHGGVFEDEARAYIVWGRQVIAQAPTLLVQRDEPLAALKVALATCPACGGTGIAKRQSEEFGAGDFACWVPWCQQARAAIASVEEEA